MDTQPASSSKAHPAKAGAAKLRVLAGLVGLGGLGCGGGSDLQAPPAATTIAINAGDHQSAAPGSAVAMAPSVKITDSNSDGVSGVSVTFAVASGGGSITAPTQQSDQAGIATVGSWTLGSTAVPNTLSASATGLDGSPITFTATVEIISITGVSPSSGPLAGGTSITISGANFVNVTQVTAGGQPLGSFTVVSAGQITGQTPASTTAGPQDVVVTSSSHGTGTCSGCFSYATNIVLATLTAGGGHTCTLSSGGAAHCWGWNYFGQLGNGKNQNTSLSVPVSGGLSFSSLTAGGSHTCGLTQTGKAYCWGSNDVGQLGNGGSDSSAVPVPVSGGLIFSALSAGGSANYARYSHTCAITTEGKAYCWGFNDAGELGDGSFNSSPVPVPVSGGLRFIELASGDFRTCGLTPAGAAYCWGWGEAGQLGNGSGVDENTPVPVAVSGGLTFSSLSAGSEHNCALTRAGAAYCWGWNDFGQLGDGSNSSSYVPVPVSGGLTFAALAVGGGYSCGLTRTGAVYCWGHNAYGQLGDGSTTYTSVPVAVTGGLTFAALNAGGWHNCGPTTGGVVYCWGNNEVGQLGNGTNDDSAVPVAVSQQEGVTAAAATAERSLGTVSSAVGKLWSDPRPVPLGAQVPPLTRSAGRHR